MSFAYFFRFLFIELEAEFVERNNNLKKTWNHIVDTIDNVRSN